MTSIQDIPVEIIAIIFGFQPNWFLPILSLVNTKFRKATELCSSNHETPTYEKIASFGWLSVLEWLRVQDPPCLWNERVCRKAAEGGHLEVLKWLRKQDPPCPWDYWTYNNAVEGGYLQMQQWLKDNGCPLTYGIGRDADGHHIQFDQKYRMKIGADDGSHMLFQYKNSDGVWQDVIPYIHLE